MTEEQKSHLRELSEEAHRKEEHYQRLRSSPPGWRPPFEARIHAIECAQAHSEWLEAERAFLRAYNEARNS